MRSATKVPQRDRGLHDAARELTGQVGYGRSCGMWRSLVSAPALGAGGRRFESGHPDQLRAHVDLDETRHGSQTGSHVLPCRAWSTARGAGTAKARSTSITPPAAVTASTTGGCQGRWRGSISLGFGADGRRIRRKVSGRTKTEIKDKLQLLHDELREGTRSSPRYTVQNAVDDWLAHGLDGRSAKTVSTNQEVLAPLTAHIGDAKLKELTAADVGAALAQIAVSRSTRAVQMARSSLIRVIRFAEANDLAGGMSLRS